MRTETTKVYVTNDGKRFVDRKEAELHETKLEHVRYFSVKHHPDLTEGRGLYHESLIMVHAKGCWKQFAEHYCYKKFGNRIAFVMGVFGSNAITQNWVLKEVEAPEEKSMSKYEFVHRIEEKYVPQIWEGVNNG